ncbi:MAG: carbon starvation protein A [Spirochaetia bacterium]|nr:carbon starvation protein A [Spirochaetia bacterium]
MITYITGFIILIAGGIFYGRFCERILSPFSKLTPAVKFTDGLDFVGMPKWKNCLIQLLNIAGTGPVLGPIQGILFGPVAFITIPVGCVIAGAFHDYMVGMLSIRNDGKQMPAMVRNYLGNGMFLFYNIIAGLLLTLFGAVLIYTPGDLLASGIFRQSASPDDPLIWIIYGVILLYYMIATVAPIDKIIGRVYPVFGAILILSAVGIFFGIFIKGYPLDELWTAGMVSHPAGFHFFPVFFVTVACGIISGFHATQSTMISRTVRNEKEGRMTFYNMMLVEGFIAMTWAGGAMGVYNLGLASYKTDVISIVSIISSDLLGKAGGMLAISCVIVLSVTSGDTAFRSLRLIIGEIFHIDQRPMRNRLLTAFGIMVVIIVLLIFAKTNANGFKILWQYFALENQTLAVFSFAIMTVYMIKKRMPFLMAMLPGAFYMFIVCCYILNARIGFNLPYAASVALGILLAIVYCILLLRVKKKLRIR